MDMRAAYGAGTLADPPGGRHTGAMWWRGVVGEDEPDPQLRRHEEVRQLPMPVFGLVPQPHLEDWGALSEGSATRYGVLDSCEVSISYTFWRNPDQPEDPVNLAELDEEERRALDAQPPWPRPPWLLEQVRRLRYPVLWECVRTQWSREPPTPDLVPAVLVGHVNHILANRFRNTRAGDRVDQRSVEHGVPVLVDGTTRTGIRIDTDPDVYGLGVALGPDTVLTAAIPRDALPYLDVAFAVRPV
jgi:hypothetical protein